MQMMATRLLLVLAVVVGSCPLAAQSDTAEITGRIVDASGAVVPAVAVVVRNDETGVKRQISTSDPGVYSVPLLHPGRSSFEARHRALRAPPLAPQG